MEKQEIHDELNPNYLFSLTWNKLLVAIVSGEVDPVQIARQELAKRGLDQSGKWVGFDEAAKIAKLPTLAELADETRFWGIHKGNLNVFIKDGGFFYIAGGWEGDFKASEIELVSVIVEPKKSSGKWVGFKQAAAELQESANFAIQRKISVGIVENGLYHWKEPKEGKK